MDADAASRRWDQAWEDWWHAHGKGEPWKEDTTSWPVAPQGLGAWSHWPGLSLPEGSAEPDVGFVGQMWLSTHVSLTAAQAAQPATLELGRANEEEKSWVNGQGVGGSSQQPNAMHKLPRGLLRAGDNIITLNIFCSWKNCGLSGPASTRLIRSASTSPAYPDRCSARWTGAAPGRSCRGSAAEKHGPAPRSRFPNNEPSWWRQNRPNRHN